MEGFPPDAFAPCPASPNCVSTRADPKDKQHYLTPLRLSKADKSVMAEIVAILTEQPRTTIVTKTETYLHAEVRSRIFRFVDDVEVFVDQANNLVHFRSASRLGYGDFGVNRRRLEKLKGDLRNRL